MTSPLPPAVKVEAQPARPAHAELTAPATAASGAKTHLAVPDRRRAARAARLAGRRSLLGQVCANAWALLGCLRTWTRT